MKQRIRFRKNNRASEGASPPSRGRPKGGSLAQLTDQHGFTLHEVLVAIVVSSLLIGFGLSLFLFAQRLLLAHERTSSLKSAVDRILFVISTDIERSCRLEDVSDSTLVICLPNRRFVSYRFDGTTVQRNSTPLHEDAYRLRVALTGFDRPSGSRVSPRALEIRVTGERGTSHYEAGTIALIPWSARQEFSTTAARIG